jgi:hypothetical protein
VDDNFDGGKMLEGTADIDDVMASYVLPYYLLRIGTDDRLVMIDRGVSRGSHFVCPLKSLMSEY